MQKLQTQTGNEKNRHGTAVDDEMADIVISIDDRNGGTPESSEDWHGMGHGVGFDGGQKKTFFEAS